VTGAVLRTDGGSRGNPGPAGAGFVIESDGAIICRGGRFLGSHTNNVAEYEALIWGLENVAALGFGSVTVYADSELLVKQINGQYRVKNEGLKPLFAKALKLLRGFSAFKVVHVRREQNVEADEMANQAMDERAIVGDPACEPGGATSQGALF
jgi:ribonuclease HI